jgi:CheY-like chemotaxis protein
MLLTLMLEKMGHQVTAVENGLEAFLIANETPFDLILMDLQMPEMDGMTATRRIRTQRGLNHATHIWAVSAHVDVTTQHELKEAGFDDALLKPVKAERLSFVLSALRAQA